MRKVIYPLFAAYVIISVCIFACFGLIQYTDGYNEGRLEGYNEGYKMGSQLSGVSPIVQKEQNNEGSN